MGVVKDLVVRTGWHWQFGWLRRRDLDDAHGYCYEEPDGDQVFFRDAECQNMVILEERVISETGETYLCLCHDPPNAQQRRDLVKLYMKFKLPKRAKG